MVTLTTGPCLRFDSFAPSGAINSGKCANTGGCTAERFEDQHVLERVRQMILTANDVADAQIHVIGAGRHVIRRHAVAAKKSEVFDIRRHLGL